MDIKAVGKRPAFKEGRHGKSEVGSDLRSGERSVIGVEIQRHLLGSRAYSHDLQLKVEIIAKNMGLTARTRRQATWPHNFSCHLNCDRVTLVLASFNPDRPTQ